MRTKKEIMVTLKETYDEQTGVSVEPFDLLSTLGLLVVEVLTDIRDILDKRGD